VTDREALYQAVLANPEDDLPRLVFADWLEEHGEGAYAAFIRVQCELARVPEYDVAWAKARLDEDRWIHGVPFRRYLPELPEGVTWPDNVFHRGFPQSVMIWTVANTDFEAIIKLAPIRQIEFVPIFDNLTRNIERGRCIDLYSSPLFRQITRYCHYSSMFYEEQALAINRSRFLSPLLHLKLETDQIDLANEAACHIMQRLQSLNIWSCSLDIWQSLIRAFSTMESSHLQLLDLALEVDCWPELAELAQTPAGDSLTTLRLAGFPTLLNFSSAMTEQTAFPQLRSVAWTLCRALINDQHLPTPSVPRWKALRLADMECTGPFIPFLLGAGDGLNGVVSLDIEEVDLRGKKKLTDLANSLHLSNLHELRLAHCKIGKEALAFATSKQLQNIVRLDLRDNPLSDIARQALRERFGERVQFDEKETHS